MKHGLVVVALVSALVQLAVALALALEGGGEALFVAHVEEGAVL